jgi:hypothetical protein
LSTISIPGAVGATESSGASHRKTSILIFLGLMAYLVLVKLVVDRFYPEVFRAPSQAAVFGWTAIGIWTVLGLVGVLLSERTGFPALWDKRISNAQRLLVPALIGLGFGVIYVGWDMITGELKAAAIRHGIESINIVFPASVLIYPAGAIIVEILYRLAPLPILMWLISNLMLRKRYEKQVLVVLVILVSLFEPLTNPGVREYVTLGFPMGILAFLKACAFNGTLTYLFCRSGFISLVLMRVSFYVLWHMVYGLFV